MDGPPAQRWDMGNINELWLSVVALWPMRWLADQKVRVQGLVLSLFSEQDGFPPQWLYTSVLSIKVY